MTYYKGLIINTTNLKEYGANHPDSIGYYSLNPYKTDDIRLYDSYFKNASIESILKIKRIILDSIKHDENIIEITDTNLLQYFNQIYTNYNQKKVNVINNCSNSLASSSIVYELVKDKEGNLFGRELYTKQLFPIYNSKCEKFDYSLVFNGNNDYNFYMQIVPDIIVSSLLKCDNFIVGHKVADLNDFNRYMNKFRGRRILKKREDKDIEEYKNKIITLANENVFKEDFELEESIPKKEIIKEKQNIETSLMEDIEFNLIKLKDIKKDLYLEYQNKYNDLLNKDITREDLALLLGEIEYSLIFNKRDIKEILLFTNNLKEEYLNNLINKNNEKTEITFKQLDKINELFLRIKDKFNYQNQREVLKNLAFLYLMETIENIDLITEEDLLNSYFISHLKSIVWWINYLIEENIIECDYIISLRNELNIEIVLDMIQNIKIKQQKRVKILKK